MKRDILRMVFCSMIYLIFSIDSINAEYIEGIDTTDANGCGLDSAFQISTTRGIIKTNKTLQIIYYYQESDAGYFHYSFDDLKMAPASVKLNDPPGFSSVKPICFCFVIQNKDSTYSKIEVIGQNQDNRFIFRWGTNTIPNNRFLIANGYDRTTRYKPNNLHMCFTYNYRNDDTISWEPPLSNDNHLLGYKFYVAKSLISIDTTMPIDLSQWDSTIVSDSSCKIPCGQLKSYYNIVAVYSEGKSDFLKGWTRNTYPSVHIESKSERAKNSYYQINIIKSSNGLFARTPRNNFYAFSVFNIFGQRITFLPNNKLLNITQLGLAKGKYIFKAELPDRSVITQPFTVTR